MRIQNNTGLDLDIEYTPETITIKQAEKLPPKPSQEWLDKHGVELTGECKSVPYEDIGKGIMFAHFNDAKNTHNFVESNRWCSRPCWILRKKPVDPYAEAKKWYSEGKLQVDFTRNKSWQDWKDVLRCDVEPCWDCGNWKPTDFRRKPDELYSERTSHFYNILQDHAEGIADFINQSTDAKAHVSCGGTCLTIIKREKV